MEQTRGGAYILRDVTGAIMDRKMTIDMLKPIEQGQHKSEENLVHQEEVNKDNNHFEVQGILDHRYNRKSKQNEYLVRWLGYQAEDDTWIGEEEFDDIAVIKNYWKQKKQGKI